MPTLEHDNLVFRFPEIEKDASFWINFQRTLKIPDSDETYPLPPGLGRFPVRHAEDYAPELPDDTNTRGGVILPMWQAEAMWLNFSNKGPESGLPFPVAIKVAAGKINAVTGESWRAGLHRKPQDYMVSPRQPWLDGFAIEKGIIRQFVAMPLGEGYSVEEQLTGQAEWGGLQICVAPLKKKVWRQKRDEWERGREERERRHREAENASSIRCYMPSAPGGVIQSSLGMAAGGKMRQVIHPDPFKLEEWDFSAADRVFVTLVHAKEWKKITGDPASNMPPTAKDYTQAGLPWFEHYGVDQSALEGSERLAKVKSVATLFNEFTGADLPDSLDFIVGTPVALGPGARGPRPVRTSGVLD